MDSKKSLLSQLNENQKKAVLHKEGVLVVHAGAGSGKTRVITTRIAHLIVHEEISPASIVALTFTNKAGAEMRKRIKELINVTHNTQLPFIGTFHSYCLRILKSNPDFFDPAFSLFDESDQEKLMRSILKKFTSEKKISTRKALSALSHIKTQRTSLDAIGDPLIRTLYIHYEAEKKACRALDFDDLIIETLHLFCKSDTFKESHQRKIRHILVDEYQDTNHLQHKLLKSMSLANKKFALDSLCVVGDENQSIYSWRGAMVSNILDFPKEFPKTKTITIDQNYRSVMPILETANYMIEHNKTRRKKQLWSNRPAQDRVSVLYCASEHHESEVIITAIKEALKTCEPSHIAVLYRSHYQSRTIEESLIRHALPYKIVGGIQFYERQEIKDLIAYLRLATNPFDRVSFTRIINTPSRGLGQKFIELFIDTWNLNNKLNFKEVGQILLGLNALSTSKKSSLQNFLALFEKLDLSSATTCLESIIADTDYLSYIRSIGDEKEAQGKLENIQELLQAFYYFESQEITQLTDILDEIALVQEMSSRKQSDNCVKLMTIHAAKGLEFFCVFLIGLENGIFPSSHAMFDAQSLEEERRLMYVALTRAEERILITHSRFRSLYGQLNNQRPSPFLKELPQEHVRYHDTSHWSSIELCNFLENWFLDTNKFPPPKRETTIQPQAFTFDKPADHKWRKYQPVTHEYFGAGLIEKIEEKGNKTFITVKFKRGSTKKIAAEFLSSQ